jgi:hypothetical protein
MAYRYKNISGTTPVKLIEKGSNLDIHCIKICNTKDSGDIKVNLYIHYNGWIEKANLSSTYRDGPTVYTTDATGKSAPSSYVHPIIAETEEEFKTTYYILKNKSVVNGVNLLLEDNILLYDIKKYDLYIALDDPASTADLILNIVGSTSSNINITSTSSSSNSTVSSSSSSGSSSGGGY